VTIHSATYLEFYEEVHATSRIQLVSVTCPSMWLSNMNMLIFQLIFFHNFSFQKLPWH